MLTLEELPNRSTRHAPRWLLTSESGVWRDWEAMKSGLFSAECGDSWEANGVAHSGHPTLTILT